MKRLLMAALLLSVLTTTSTAQASNLLSKTEEMLSSIGQDMWYHGSEVRDAIRSLLALALDESRSTAERAAAAAVRPAVDDLRAEVERRVSAERDRDWWVIAAAAGGVGTVLAVLAAVLFAVF